ncbi:MAG: MATE family efflux transporter [Ruminococcaceae bacterium]|nr:MATE family efflux transporter [Oscillospiraceae bacterium]
MLHSKNVKMTEGPIFRSVIVYSIPIVLSGILQIFFNAADLAVVGNFSQAKTTATAAVGATGSFISLIVNTVMGLSTGVNVTLARSLGAKEREQSSRISHTAIAVSVIAGILVGILGFLIAPFAMSITKCPPEAKEQAILYLRIYFCGAPGIFLYNFGSAVLRTKGDTRRPLNFLIVSGITNVVLNLIFVIVFRMNAEGVALATTLSQYLAAFLTFRCLLHQEDETRIDISCLRIHGKEFLSILRFGIPSGLSSAMYSLSNLQIQSAINHFGESAVAGNAAASSLESFIGAGITAVSAASTAFVGQNIGAGNRKRVGKVILACLTLVVAYSLILGVGMYLIGEPLYRIYVSNDHAAIEVAVLRGSLMLTLYWLMGIFNVFGAVSQTLGYAVLITVNSIIGICGIRTLWMQFFYPHYNTLEAVYICYPITWTLITLAHGVVFAVAYYRYQKKGTVH